MSRPPEDGAIVYGPFTGMDERDGVESFVKESLNVVFEDGAMRRRPGRERILSEAPIRPTKVVWYDGATATATDVTAAATDGDYTTAAIAAPFAHAASAIYVGFPFRITGIQIYLSAVTGPGVMSVGVFDRDVAPRGTFAFIASTDGTSVAGVTLQQNGTIAWTTAIINSSGVWTSGAYTGIAAIDTALAQDQDLFWVQLNTGVAMAGGAINELRGTLRGTEAYTSAAEPSSLTEFRTRSGAHLLVVTQDHPGRYTDDALYAAGVWPQARITAYDLGRGDMIPLRLPRTIDINSDPGAFVSCVAFNGWLIGATTGGFLWRFDGASCGALEGMPGMDAQKNVLGADYYLPSVPRGRILSTYHNKLMVTDCPGEPLSFYASIEDNNISTIPSNAPVGGPNVWPLKHAYRLPAKDGDRITGAVVINDRYVVFTQNTIWTFDESSLRVANPDFGCVAPGSIQKVDSQVFFLAPTGVGMFDGLNATIISGPLSKTLKLVNWQAASGAVSAHDRLNTEYWLWLPINGERFNSMAIVYNYTSKSWRVVSSWYPTDTNARRDANSYVFRVSAATTVTGVDGRPIIITCNTAGDLVQEGIGRDDLGKIFPAYALLSKVNIKGEYSAYRAWYLDLEPDGQWFEGYALPEGESLIQEIDRRYANVSTLTPIVHKQALLQNCVGGPTQPTFAVGAAWNDAYHVPRRRKLKMSFGQHATIMQPAILWVPGQYSAGSYVSQVAANGTIKTVRVELEPEHQAR